MVATQLVETKQRSGDRSSQIVASERSMKALQSFCAEVGVELELTFSAGNTNCFNGWMARLKHVPSRSYVHLQRTDFRNVFFEARGQGAEQEEAVTNLAKKINGKTVYNNDCGSDELGKFKM